MPITLQALSRPQQLNCTIINTIYFIRKIENVKQLKHKIFIVQPKIKKIQILKIKIYKSIWTKNIQISREDRGRIYWEIDGKMLDKWYINRQNFEKNKWIGGSDPARTPHNPRPDPDQVRPKSLQRQARPQPGPIPSLLQHIGRGTDPGAVQPACINDALRNEWLVSLE